MSHLTLVSNNARPKRLNPEELPKYSAITIIVPLATPTVSPMLALENEGWIMKSVQRLESSVAWTYMPPLKAKNEDEAV